MERRQTAEHPLKGTRFRATVAGWTALPRKQGQHQVLAANNQQNKIHHCHETENSLIRRVDIVVPLRQTTATVSVDAQTNVYMLKNYVQTADRCK